MVMHYIKTVWQNLYAHKNVKYIIIVYIMFLACVYYLLLPQIFYWNEIQIDGTITKYSVNLKETPNSGNTYIFLNSSTFICNIDFEVQFTYNQKQYIGKYDFTCSNLYHYNGKHNKIMQNCIDTTILEIKNNIINNNQIEFYVYSRDLDMERVPLRNNKCIDCNTHVAFIILITCISAILFFFAFNISLDTETWETNKKMYVTEDMRCPICQFNCANKILTCGHIFCSECINTKLTKNGLIICPECGDKNLSINLIDIIDMKSYATTKVDEIFPFV